MRKNCAFGISEKARWTDNPISVLRGFAFKKILERSRAKRHNEDVFTYKGLDHIALVTKKLAAMKSFYVEGLGLTLEQEGKAKAGYSVVTLRAGESLIDLFEASPTNPAPPANLSEEHICLSATGSSIYDVIATLKRKGLEPTQAEVNSGAKGKGLSTWVRDPDGNKVEIKVD
jgi:glyoxylase I family protein